MKKYAITIRTHGGAISYTALAASSLAAMLEAYELGALGVTVKAVK